VRWSPHGLLRCWLSLVTLAVCVSVARSVAAEPEPSSATGNAVDFNRDVRPLLAKHCFSCHGAERQESDFRLDRRDDALRGGANGVAILPGKAQESPLTDRIAGADPDLRMPPKGDLLPPEAVAVIRTWIDQGANWSADSETAATVKVDHWSLKPLVRPAVPRATASTIVQNPIDAFVAATLGEHGLKPSVEADRRTLIRRVAVDLTGLPPTPEELAKFLADTSPDAYELLVDRLLASPRYGERWARHWMDVAHFSETHGNDQDRPRPNAWPYRDYLVHSFNADKPYARFVGEQVAGDVLYPDDPQATVALGFLAAGICKKGAFCRHAWLRWHAVACVCGGLAEIGLAKSG